MRPSIALAALACTSPPALAGSLETDPGPPLPCEWRHYDEEPRCPGRVARLDYNDGTDATQAGDAEPMPAAPPPAPARPPLGEPRDWQWQGDLALALGNARVDGAAVDTYPTLVAAAGVHRERWTLLGEYALGGEHYHAATIALGSTTLPPRDTDGIVHHVGVAARYAFLHGFTADDTLAADGDLWLQGDGGEEFVRWDEGGLLARPYLGLALGLQGALHGQGHRRHAMYLAFRVQVARRTDLDGAAATCSAPCTEATPPAVWSDRSVQVRIGFAWGP